MSDSIHGHQVLTLLSEQVWPSQNQAEQFLQQTFGPQSQFHTCKKQGLTLSELLAFFIKASKFVLTDSGWQVQTHRICSHK